VKQLVAEVTVVAQDQGVALRAVAVDGRLVVLRLGVGDALVLADELTIAAQRPAVRAAA
jgi:hypothetical protein